MSSKKRKYEFRCKGCGKMHQMSMYAVAQLAQRHDIDHTCPTSNYVMTLSHEKFISEWNKNAKSNLP